MAISQLEGYWLSGHIRELKRQQQQEHAGKDATTSTLTTSTTTSSSSGPSQAGGETPPPVAGDLPAPRALHSALDAEDPTVQALNEALDHADKVVEAARAALVSYLGVSRPAAGRRVEDVKGERVKHRGTFGEAEGPSRRGGAGGGSG